MSLEQKEQIIVDEDVFARINEQYNLRASPNDVEHYKLVQVILNLESRIRLLTKEDK